MFPGVLLVHKPLQESSYEQIRKLKKYFPKTKIGHCGTLDPFAEGLLIVLLGKAVKLQDYFLNFLKIYRVVINFGYETNTLDNTGFTTKKTFQKVALAKKEINEILQKKFVGEISQLPPAYSALKVNGKRAYELARKGVGVNLVARNIAIKKVELEKWDREEQQITLKVVCGSGTYIRSLARDLGYALGSLATASKLVRLQIGELKISESIFLTSDIAERENVEKKIIPLNKIIIHHSIKVNDDELNLVKNGNFLFLQDKIKLGYNFIYQKEKILSLIYKNKKKTKIVFNQIDENKKV